MAYDLGLSLSLLPPHGNGASDMGIIIKKQEGEKYCDRQ